MENQRTIKNKKIKETLLATKSKRSLQECSVFKVKIQSNKLSKLQEEHLKMMFVEAKWIINDIISTSLNYNIPIWKYTLQDEITKKDKDMNDVKVKLSYLGSQMKQSIVTSLISNIRTLSTLKKKGYKIGKLKFRKECKSIELKQHGITYKILSKNKIKIQGIKKPLYVNGLDQIDKKYEFANAKLLNTQHGYFLAITCYKNKEEIVYDNSNEIGIDFGISTHLTLSNGIKINASVQESDRLKRLQRKFSKQKKGSKNRFKTLYLIKREYEKMSNKKNDLANKIVHNIVKNRYVFIQDENLVEWKIKFGKAIHHSVLGRVKAKLKAKENVFVLDRWQPTTKFCYNCGQLNKISLNKRVYECDCGIEPEDRDIHAAKNMIILSKIGMGCTEFKPVDIKTSTLKDVSLVDEAGRSLIKEDSTSLV